MGLWDDVVTALQADSKLSRTEPERDARRGAMLRVCPDMGYSGHFRSRLGKTAMPNVDADHTSGVSSFAYCLPALSSEISGAQRTTHQRLAL